LKKNIEDAIRDAIPHNAWLQEDVAAGSYEEMSPQDLRKLDSISDQIGDIVNEVMDAHAQHLTGLINEKQWAEKKKKRSKKK
jgi:hypothetical protein